MSEGYRAPLSYDPDEPQYPQEYDWTCSACALAWLNRALGIHLATDELSATNYIGVPENINSQYGLMDGSGARLVTCLREQGAPAVNGWFDWDTTVELAARWPLLIGGVSWYHWVGVRSTDMETLHLANSAPGWMGIDNYLYQSDFDALGPFAVIAVPLLTHFPPPPTA